MATEPVRTLSSAIEVIPAECYENPTWKGLLYVCRDLAVYGATLTALFWAETWWLVVPLWILSALCLTALLGCAANHLPPTTMPVVFSATTWWNFLTPST